MSSHCRRTVGWIRLDHFRRCWPRWGYSLDTGRTLGLMSSTDSDQTGAAGRKYTAAEFRPVDFFGLTPTERTQVWSLSVEQRLSTSGGFLFGGCGLGAALAVLEELTGRPAIWATAQFLSFAMLGETVEIETVLVASGHFTAQARAVARVGDREILTVNAAFGARPAPWNGQWYEMPAAPPPLDCPPREATWFVPGTIGELTEIRMASGRQWADLNGVGTADGRSLLWARASEIPVSTTLLSILGDYVPYGISQALGLGNIMANSLDNTLRVLSLAPSEWVLIDIGIAGIGSGFGHGEVRIWAEDSTLLAIASQSSIIREHRG